MDKYNILYGPHSYQTLKSTHIRISGKTEKYQPTSKLALYSYLAFRDDLDETNEEELEKIILNPATNEDTIQNLAKNQKLSINIKALLVNDYRIKEEIIETFIKSNIEYSNLNFLEAIVESKYFTIDSQILESVFEKSIKIQPNDEEQESQLKKIYKKIIFHKNSEKEMFDEIEKKDFIIKDKPLSIQINRIKRGRGFKKTELKWNNYEYI